MEVDAAIDAELDVEVDAGRRDYCSWLALVIHNIRLPDRYQRLNRFFVSVDSSLQCIFMYTICR